MRRPAKTDNGTKPVRKVAPAPAVSYVAQASVIKYVALAPVKFGGEDHIDVVKVWIMGFVR